MATAKKTNKSSESQSDLTEALEIGAAALAVAAAAGATYYFYGDKQAKKHRAAATKWAKGLKSEVLAEAKKLKNIDKAAMIAVVNKAAEAYKDVRTVDRTDLRAAAAELKKNWRNIEAEIRGITSTRASNPKKTTTKATPKKSAGKKTVAKKAAPKKSSTA